MLALCYRVAESVKRRESYRLLDHDQPVTACREGQVCLSLKFIMIDEYQDISPDRLARLCLCNQSKSEHQASIFAVMTGSPFINLLERDVDLTTGFKDRFESSTIHHLDTTYRFNNQLGAVANRFVQENPIQLPKELNSLLTETEGGLQHIKQRC